MSASMAEVLAKHRYMYGKGYSAGRVEVCACGWETTPDTEQKSWEALAAHQAEQLAAAGFGDVREARTEGVAIVANAVRGPLISIVQALEFPANLAAPERASGG